MAFLLAAPIVNPVVIAGTYAAFGWGPVLLGRIGFGLLVAFSVGVVFSLHPAPMSMMRLHALPTISGGVGEVTTAPPAPTRSFSEKLRGALRIAGDEFFEMGRYLVIGSLLAALMQTLVPQSALLAIGSGPLLSVIVMQMLAFVLSICSTVDAFLALAFVNTFSTGSVLSFLVFGPMVDIKSLLMFLGVFRRKYVAYLVLLPFLMTMLIGVFLNLNVGW
jgi:uncharacterized membrane protein YraQ (UPF0718 family)